MNALLHFGTENNKKVIFSVLLSSNKNFTLEEYLEPVVCPTPKLHDARLLVEGEILDIHLAARVVNGRRFPLHLPGRHQRRLRCQGHLEVAVGAEIE